MMTVAQLMRELMDRDPDLPVVFRAIDFECGISLVESTPVLMETHDRCGTILRDAVVLHSDEPGD